jgi:hypothetical protein
MTTISYHAMIIALTILAGLIALPIFSVNSLTYTTSSTTAYAQSQSQSQQQQSQPPEKQPEQLGTQHIFNNKSKPANAPEFCASLASVVLTCHLIINIVNAH